MEGGRLQYVTLHPRQQRLEAVLLRSPQESFSVFRVIAVSVGALLEQSAIVRKSFGPRKSSFL
jgi:hypothetical protein